MTDTTVKRSRGRPRKNPLPVASSPETAPIGHNDKSDRQKQQLLLVELPKLENLLAKQAQATADVRNQYKSLKSDGFSRSEVKYALYLRKRSEDEAIEDAKMRERIGKYLGHPIGTQFRLFDELPDRTPAIEKAFNAGKKAGLNGMGATPPHSPGTEQAQSWLKGWHEGQAVLIGGGIKQKPTSQDEAPEDDPRNDAPIGNGEEENESAEDERDMRPRFLQEASEDSEMRGMPGSTRHLN